MTQQTNKLGQLLAKISEARDLLLELESESERLRQSQQHEEIEHLEAHMEEAEFNLNKLTPFKDEVIEELRMLLLKLKALR
jgi:hypothetical protein